MQNRFSLWKNIALLVLLIISAIYAIPNIYSEEPALQISILNGEKLSSLENKIATLLAANNIPYLNSASTANVLELRFASADLQLKASDIIKAALGDDYTIAMNLMPTTPKWLQALYAKPMAQGLDLRGGVHFLLEVDVAGMVNRRYESLTQDLKNLLRKNLIRYAGIRSTSQGVQIHFRDAAYLDATLKILNQQFALFTTTKIDPQTLTVVLSAEELHKLEQSVIDQTMKILSNRVNELGVGEAFVQQQGSSRIAVDLPGIQDAVRAKQILGGTATLQFYIVDSENDAALAQQTKVVPPGSKLYNMYGRPILLKKSLVLSGDAITSANATIDSQTATPSVDIELGAGAISAFTKVTSENIGHMMAIVFVETKVIEKKVADDLRKIFHRTERIISAPVIQSALGARFQITGLKDFAEAQNLSLLLRAGSLPTAIYPIEERTIGPSLGQENIHRGIVSLSLGMGLIMVLMLVYYRFFGLVANLGLLCNLIMLTALLSIIGATLTLPGIAGIVLTVGMAVDANVLIYERIREELRSGTSVQSAIFAGFERAFTTILDANITTFLVAIVLFSVGSGAIKGFAVTLSLGLLTSMLTSVTYTRAIVNLVYGGRRLKTISIGI
jgi:preprotein translocase subunit SecD